MIFADLPAPESPAAVGWWILTFGGLMVGLYYTLEVIGKLRGRQPVETQIAGQPIEVRAATTFATKVEHKELAEKLDTELGRERASRKGLYDRLEKQGQTIATLQAETTHQTRQLQNLDSKMDQVLLRLPRPPTS